ncbi:MAG: hypothetical protein WDO17_21425 [Alphaproteobacteria bacterium]
MAFRIFDHLLVHHGWNASGRLVCAALAVASGQVERPNESATGECADLERRSLLARLAYRGKQDRALARVARYLQADPSLSLHQLAAELGVSEDHLSRSLQAVLGQGADRLVR